MSKPFIYIASPYTKGDVAINTRFQMQLFDELMNSGLVWPVAPLWSHFQHLAFPRPYKDWIEYDLALLPRMDACLRMNASYQGVNTPYQESGRRHVDYFEKESAGADGEVAVFKRLGKPVFFNIPMLLHWASTEWMEAA